MCFFFINGIADFDEKLIFSKKKLVKVSADCDRIGIVTCFHASLDVKRCQFALLMLSIVVVVCDFKFLL